MRYLIIAIMLLALSVPVSVRAGQVNSGAATCPASGNKVLSSTSINASWVSIQAPSGNVDKVYLGGPTVDTASGVYISAGQTAAFLTQGNAAVYNLKTMYFACGNSSDTITFNYMQ